MVESGFPVGHSMLDRQGHGPRAAACPDRNSRWRERCVVRDEHDHSVTKLTTAEIARGLLVPEATICATHHAGEGADSGQWYEVHHARRRGERPAREAAVLRVLYLVFNEGYTATSGARLHRVELSTEAIRLTRQLRAALPGEGEVAGLLALMLLTDARRAARTTPAGGLVPLPDQDRSRWDQALIAEGSALLTGTLPTSTVGPYQVQAAIAAVHDEARSATDTDWPQILGLYDILLTTAPGPIGDAEPDRCGGHGPRTGDRAAGAGCRRAGIGWPASDRRGPGTFARSGRPPGTGSRTVRTRGPHGAESPRAALPGITCATHSQVTGDQRPPSGRSRRRRW